MDLNLDNLIIEWAYRVHNGRPDVKNSEHLDELRIIMTEEEFPGLVIDGVIRNLREEDLVKNKETGNVYMVQNVDKSKHDLIKKNASPDDLAKSKEDDEEDEEKSEPKEEPKEEPKKVNIFNDDAEISPSLGLDKKATTLVQTLFNKITPETAAEHLRVANTANMDLLNSMMSDIKAFSSNPTSDKANAIIQKYQMSVNKEVDSGPSKLYVNALKGQDRKVLSGMAGSLTATALQTMLKKAGGDLSPDKKGMQKKSAVPSKVFDTRNEIAMSSNDKMIKFGSHTFYKPTDDDIQKLDSIINKKYKDTPDKLEKNKYWLEKVKKHKLVLDNFDKFLSGDSLQIIEMHPGADLSTEKGRIDTRKTAEKKLAQIISKQTKSKESKQIVKSLLSLNNFSGSKEEYNDVTNQLLFEISKNPETTPTSADIAEIIAAMQELNNGRAVYMPEAANFKLGDLLVLPAENMVNIKDIITSISNGVEPDSIYIQLDNKSIKKDVGGASASDGKIQMTAYKNGAQVKDDLTSIVSAYDDIFVNPDLKKVDNHIAALEKKYSYIFKDNETYQTSIYGGKLGSRTISSAEEKIKTQQKSNPNINMEQHSRYYKLGVMMQEIYNHEVERQGFSNTKFKVQSSGVKTAKSNGIDPIAFMKFEWNVGFSKNSGMPGNKLPTRMVH